MLHQPLIEAWVIDLFSAWKPRRLAHYTGDNAARLAEEHVEEIASRSSHDREDVLRGRYAIDVMPCD